MLFKRRHHRRWVAVVATLGLLFQQLAMAAYVCPLERSAGASDTVTTEMPDCQSPDTTDKAQCQQHCHPLAQASDHATPPTVPMALLPATTWPREFPARIDLPSSIGCDIDARATAPPLTIQHCTFQI